MSPGRRLERKQIWRSVASSTSSSIIPAHCTPFTLPSNGIIALDVSSTITINSDAVFQPECTNLVGAVPPHLSDPSSVADLRDPFYASTIPQAYAIAAATVLSYMLVIMLFITPRTFFFRGTTGGRRFLGGRGILSGAAGGSSVIGVGRRPWLQKVAALTVAISLTIASADTFKVAKRQYEVGFMDAIEMRDEVVGSLEIEVVRVISDTFLWLAQVQTLIRLFPRHKEKVIIKWAGFALILLDTLFSILNSFVYPGTSRPRSYVDAIPALSYLFQLALSLLYAAWVIYYSLSKRRYAFYHPRMRNICLVAVLALTSILVPAVFFVLDISNPSLAGWGDYIRWVGAAAASVVVWEWVERIETLEREERKDGVLGREVFDGDEMLDITPSAEINWPSNRWRNQGNESNGRGDGPPPPNLSSSTGHNDESRRTNGSVRFRMPLHPRDHQEMATHRPRHPSGLRAWSNRVPLSGTHFRHNTQNAIPSPPPAVTTPIDRADTTSAASTVYAVHYHPTSDSPGPANINPSTLPRPTDPSNRSTLAHSSPVRAGDSASGQLPDLSSRQLRAASRLTEVPDPPSDVDCSPRSPASHWEQSAALQDSPSASSASVGVVRGRTERIKSKLNSFAASQGQKLIEKSRWRDNKSQLPVKVVPAQPRNRSSEPWILQSGTHESNEANESARRKDPLTRSDLDQSSPRGNTLEASTEGIDRAEEAARVTPEENPMQRSTGSLAPGDDEAASRRGPAAFEDPSRHSN
ncbi:MAG: pH-response regulator protein palH/rim21 [Sclerophora amabilis]|nr:MAG: pH-response regulator protein palH/rim21 [Sclerophora amabilis]